LREGPGEGAGAAPPIPAAPSYSPNPGHGASAGITPFIPRRKNSKQRGHFFPKRLFRLRARVEQTIGRLKRFKRVAMRCKNDVNYSAIISFRMRADAG
jgi:hypothetical protein